MTSSNDILFGITMVTLITGVTGNLGQKCGESSLSRTQCTALNSGCRLGKPPFDNIKYCQCRRGFVQINFHCVRWTEIDRTSLTEQSRAAENLERLFLESIISARKSTDLPTKLSNGASTDDTNSMHDEQSTVSKTLRNSTSTVTLPSKPSGESRSKSSLDHVICSTVTTNALTNLVSELVKKELAREREGLSQASSTTHQPLLIAFPSNADRVSIGELVALLERLRNYNPTLSIATSAAKAFLGKIGVYHVDHFMAAQPATNPPATNTPAPTSTTKSPKSRAEAAMAKALLAASRNILTPKPT